MSNPHNTKVDCECDLCILIDEKVFGLGFRCIKCGLNADHRVKEYLNRMLGPEPKLTRAQRHRLQRLLEP